MKNFRGKNTAIRHDHYQALTDKIVEALEAGVKPWERPWDPEKASGPAMPVNAVSGRRYRGINTFILGMSPLAFMTGDPRFATYKQAAEKGWQVRKGEKSTTIYFYKTIELEKTKDLQSEDSVKRIPCLKTFNVFHASQMNGVPYFDPPKVEKPLWERIEDAEVIMRNSGVEIRTGGDRAFYSPATRHIQLPPAAAFRTKEGYAAVSLHELCHASAAPDRLNRDLTGKFGSYAYAQEEMRAEIASYFIGLTLNLPFDLDNHASYVKHWVKILKDDRREIFHAAAEAQKIADYCLAFHPAFATLDDSNQHSENDSEAPDELSAAA